MFVNNKKQHPRAGLNTQHVLDEQYSRAGRNTQPTKSEDYTYRIPTILLTITR